MTIKDIISPFAYSVWQFVGYGVFIVAGWFVLFALCRAARDVTQQIAASRSRQAPPCRVMTLVRNVERGQETVPTFQGALGARSAAHSRHGGRNV